MTLTPARITLGLAVLSGPLCIYLVQVHSVAFWQQHAQGWWTGLGWSIALELVGLLFWFQPWNGGKSWRWLGAVTTVVLLLGPLYELGTPLLADHANQGSLADEIAQVEAEHARYVTWTAEGRNFGPGLARTSEQLRVLRAKQRGESEGKQGSVTAARPTALTVLVILMQMVSVVIFYVAIVFFITVVSAWVTAKGEQGKQRKETPKGEQGERGEQAGGTEETPPAADGQENGGKETITSSLPDAQNGLAATSEPDAPTDPADEPLPPSAPQEGAEEAVSLLVDALQVAVRQRVARGESQNKVAESIGISKKGMSLLMNHQRLKASGDKVLGLRALTSLQKLLGAPVPAPRPRIPQIGDARIANAQNRLDG